MCDKRLDSSERRVERTSEDIRSSATDSESHNQHKLYDSRYKSVQKGHSAVDKDYDEHTTACRNGSNHQSVHRNTNCSSLTSTPSSFNADTTTGSPGPRHMDSLTSVDRIIPLNGINGKRLTVHICVAYLLYYVLIDTRIPRSCSCRSAVR